MLLTMRIGPVVFALSILGAQAQADSQTAAEPTAVTSQPITIVTPHAPVARQIVPMVAPIRRTAPAAAATVAAVPKRAVPEAAATPATSVSGAAPAAKVTAAAAVPVAAATLAPASAPVATPAKSASPAVAAAPAPLAPASAAVASINRAPAKAAPKQPKFVAYTCKLGEDYSVERKTCFTPGVAKSSTSDARHVVKSAASRPPVDMATRSSLGVKPKP